MLADVLGKYRTAGGSVVHVVHDTPEGHKLFTPGTKLAEIFEELAPREGEKIVHKVAASAFTKTELEAHLKTLGTKKVVLAGGYFFSGQTGYRICLIDCGIGVYKKGIWYAVSLFFFSNSSRSFLD